MALPKHLITGLRGEQLAAKYLRKNKYQILDANFATKVGETDIIAMAKDKTVCFIEVKTRSPGQLLSPSEAVDSRKEENLKSNASAFLSYYKMKDKRIRFDIIEIILYDLHNAEINHIKNAF